LPACFGQSVIAGNPAGKDGRRSQDVCPDSLFLACLDPDPARTGEKYEALREALVKFLDWRGALFPEELVDETFNRVARKLE
jgi:hypothetical protein